MAFSQLLSRALGLCGYKLVNKKLYKSSYFKKESERLLDAVGDEYLNLLNQYPTDEDSRKGLENRILFIEMLYWLGLEKSRPLKILDIGGRGGLFAYYCKQYGHDSYVSDIPGVLQTTPNRELLKLFEVNSIDLMIKPFIPIALEGMSFDLVTGFRTRFHSRLPFETDKEYEEHWGEDEWDFFLDDLSAHVLSNSGSIFFMLNRLQEREKGEYVPPKLAHLFRSKGGIINDQFLYFPMPPKRSN